MSKRNEGQIPYIDLFAGAGGLSLGFEQAGFKVVLAVENDPAAAATYERNFGIEVFQRDIREFPSFAGISARIVIGGPPCQGFSPLGKMSAGMTRRDQHGEMNSLWLEFFRAVSQIKPEAFVVENVPQFLKTEEFADFRTRVSGLGYDVAPGVLNANEFGVPQKRQRAITIGIRADLGKATLPQPTMESASVRDAIGDLPLVPTGRNLHIGRTPTKISMERYRVIPPGGNRFDLMSRRPDICPPCWIKKSTGSTDVFGRMEWDKPSLTIRTEFFKPEKGRYLHPEADRPITHREAARLQTFPDDFIFCGSKIEIARQIGNAVPPKLALKIAEHVKGIIEGKKKSDCRS